MQQKRATQEPNTWDNASHRRRQAHKNEIPRAARKWLLEEQEELYEKIYKSVKAGTKARTTMLIDELHPMARQVFMQYIKDQWEQRQQQEDDPPGTRPPPEPPSAPERTCSPRPRKEQIEILNE